MSCSTQNTPDQLRVDCFCGLRSPLGTALTDDNVGRRFLGCVNYHKIISLLLETRFFFFNRNVAPGPDEKCKSFEWVDPETCARGKEFGRWIVKKNMDLQNKLADLGKKMEECKRSEEWFEVKMSSTKNEMNEMENGFKLKMEEWQKREAWYAVKMEEVESKNSDLRKKNKVLKEKVESGKWKVNVLVAMMLAMVGIVVVFFCGEGRWKEKMLAFP
ncbi:hypothetical protein Vadar_034530 [Vaccinium darrowii]|uniref:Uncharacterized protein n=1 Tax=Vaccinium darrowii TaxID=229202 RepID=A0ACB7ZNI0_9ERIC|nr:hypothetical protein Vadar_034530 [Vaccinium darrowii]